MMPRDYEWGELEKMSKQEVSKVRLFVSSPKDRFRAKFDCGPRDMWDLERDHPWVLAIYALAGVATLVLGTIYPWGWFAP